MDRFTYKYYNQANGQLMASYNSELYNGTERTTTLEEQYIYGSNRIGTLKANKGVYFNGTHQPAMIDIQSNKIGKKRYELTNHLGNVLATISDRKIFNPNQGYYEPVITMKADYYAFGMLQPDRFEGIDESRHLFNGMEQDMEVSGEGNSYTTEFRQYDPRLGRWKSLDPLMAQFPWQSPYVAFDNNPIFFTDPLGLAAEGGGEPPVQEIEEVSVTGTDKSTKLQPKINGTWGLTPASTKRYKGVGGNHVNVPVIFTKYLKGFADSNNDGVIGFSNGTPYQGVETGMVRQFKGQDYRIYNAVFNSNGSFQGYKNDSGQLYPNEEYSKSTILSNKVEQALDYISNPNYEAQGFQPPIFQSYEEFKGGNSFSLGGETFKGSMYVTRNPISGKALTYERYLENLYISDKPSSGGYFSSGTGFVVEIWGRYDSKNQSYQHEPVIRIKFNVESEWVRFVEFLMKKYGVNDNSKYTSRSLKPSKITK